jgi:homogentisate phytyltransferase/homogentisate geranylgeranyltransferase
MLLLVGIITAAIWLVVLRPSLDKINNQRSGKTSNEVSWCFRELLGFMRPHTVKGTVLATISGYSLLSVYHGASAQSALLRVLLSGVSANVFIVGINQLVDVEIDKVNSKPLPLAMGTLSWEVARDFTGAALVSATTVGFIESFLWGSVISSMCLIGVLYSVPPFRLKRFAVPAALCIVAARGLLATIGGTLTLTFAMGKELDDFMIFHMKVFTSVLVVFTTVIALMKDVPDIEGDMSENIKSFSVMLGPSRVSGICFSLITASYIGVMAVMFGRSDLSLFTHLYGLIWLHGASTPMPSAGPTVKAIAMRNYFEVIWPLFYYEFLAYLVPVAMDHFYLRIPTEVCGTILGAELAYLQYISGRSQCASGRGSIGSVIQEQSGLDVSSLHRNLGLRGSDPCTHSGMDTPSHINLAAVEMSVALSMHSKLTRLSGKALANAKKLAILCGDWLLARAVISLCETRSQSAIREMGKAIAAATREDESLIADVIMQHAETARGSIE